MVCSMTLIGRLDLDVTVFAIATVHLQDQYTATCNTLHHSFYYENGGLFFNKIKILARAAMLWIN